MATKQQEMQKFIRHYRQISGVAAWDMHDVAKLAEKMGWKLPKPVSPLEMLAKEFSKAAREETRVDSKTGHPYRVNHAFTSDDGKQMTLWVDIDEAPRKLMLKSAHSRREQVVGDLVQLTFDLDHWNRVNSADEPIVVPLDFNDDIEWRKNGGDAQAGVA